MKPTKELMHQIEQALESVEYGSVRIEVSATLPTADIVVESRCRVRIVPPAAGMPADSHRMRNG